MIKTVPTYTATIWVGLKHRDSGTVFDIQGARALLQDYVNCGLCITLTPTEYIYTDGGEPGFSVSLINYPRFPSPPEKIREHALNIAKMLMDYYLQYRVTVVFPDETVMLSQEPTEQPA